jgi:hypothetical protein
MTNRSQTTPNCSKSANFRTAVAHPTTYEKEWGMIDLAETRVDFARECMGWEDARLAKPSDEVVLSDSRQLGFDVGDLNSVMSEVCEWCMSRRLTFSLTIDECLTQSEQPLNVWKCSVSAGRRLFGLGSSVTCVAEEVMCACVLTSRRVRRAA